MPFLSPEFAIFVTLAVAVVRCSPASARGLLMVGFSAIYYATWSLPHTALLFGVTLLVHLVTRAGADASPARPSRQRIFVAVTALVVLLAFFKTLAVFPLPHAFDAGWLDGSLLLMPLGLSYYLFKLIGYLLDVHWERMPAQRSFTALAAHVAFFPQIVSGPIQRAGDFFEQYAGIGGSSADDVVAGLRRILLGLVKKIVIADRLGPFVAAAYAHPAGCSPLELLIVGYAFTLQIYFDFSGVTDIALGLGRLFGIVGPENFDRPFFAPNIQEYWRRWHMSLTSWLRDNLFFPIYFALRRRGEPGVVVAILVNMFAVGIWHGFTWPFALFGLVNGLFLSVSVLTLRRRNAFFKTRPALARLRAWAAPLVTFHLVVFTMVIFRAPDGPVLREYLAALVPRGAGGFDLAWLDRAMGLRALALILGAAVAVEGIDWLSGRPAWAQRFAATPRLLRWTVYYACLAGLLLSLGGTRTFIYAQF